MNNIVKIEYKVTAYVVVPNTEGIDDESILSHAYDAVSGVPEKDLYWELSDTRIAEIGEEFEVKSSYSYLTTRENANKLSNNYVGSSR